MSIFRDKCIVIDLTPLLPGGTNGGLGLLAKNLAEDFARLAPACRFVWLTADDTHHQLVALARQNVELRCELARANSAVTSARLSLRVKRAAREKLKALIPAVPLAKLKALYRNRQRPKASDILMPAHPLLAQDKADLLFCPFTAPFYANFSVPTVSVVVDLQYLYYPQFFSTDDFYYRDKHFTDACRVADKIVCISDFVRKTVLEQSQLPEQKVVTIHIGLSPHVNSSEAAQDKDLFESLQLKVGRYLLYPANFWQHKNHEMLLTAWGIRHMQHPRSDLRLVLTGVPNERRAKLQAAAQQMGLAETVIFPGYLNDAKFAALTQNCHAVIFPSLYEGFGMPVLEAMALGKPVLCSNTTSLPEVGGEAVLSFDPRKPDEIASAIYRIEHEPALVESMILSGQQRAASFGNSEKMALRYLELFQQVIDTKGSGFSH